MPGTRTISQEVGVEPTFVKLAFNGTADQIAFAANGGSFAEDYIPTGELSMEIRDETGQRARVALSGKTAKEGIEEFLSQLPKCQALMKKAMNGELVDSDEVRGADALQAKFEDSIYNNGDGSGDFRIGPPSE